MKKFFLYSTFALSLALPFTAFAEYQGDDLVQGRPPECFIVDNADNLPVAAARVAVPSKNGGYTYVSDDSPRVPLTAGTCYDKNAEIEIQTSTRDEWETAAFDEEQGFNHVRTLSHFELYYDDFGFDYYLYEGTLFEYFDNPDEGGFRTAIVNGFYNHIVPTLTKDLAACDTRTQIQVHIVLHYDYNASDYRLSYVNEVWKHNDLSTTEPSQTLQRAYIQSASASDAGAQETLRRKAAAQSLVEAGCGAVQQEYLTHKANDLIAQYIGTDTLQKFKSAVKEHGNPEDVQMHATTTAGLPESPANTPKTTLPWWAIMLGIAILLGLAWLVRYSPRIGRVAQR